MSIAVNLPDEIARRLTAEAEKRGQSVDQVAAELLAGQLPPHHTVGAGKRRLAFAAIGASTSRRHARDADEMLAEGFGSD